MSAGPASSRRPSLLRALVRKSEPPRAFYAPEVFGRAAITNIAQALPPLERVYANIRFSILRPKLLSVMDLLLPDEGRILDIGCGFGLFAAYFGQTQPRRRIVGIDPNARRIEMARKVAGKLGLTEHEFMAADARDAAVGARLVGRRAVPRAARRARTARRQQRAAADVADPAAPVPSRQLLRRQAIALQPREGRDRRVSQLRRGAAAPATRRVHGRAAVTSR